MPARFTRRILDYIADRRYEPTTAEELAEELQISDDQKDAFRAELDELSKAGQVVLGAQDRVALPPPGREMTGIFRLHEKGFGFLVPDSPTEHGDLFIRNGDTLDAMSGDRVRARVIHQQGRQPEGKSPYVGRILEVLQRADRQYTGLLTKRGRTWIVEPDGRALHTPVTIGDPGAKNAREGDKVVFEIVTYGDPSKNEWPGGVILEVLGEAGEPDVETRAIMRSFGLADEFPDEVVRNAREASRAFRDDAIPPDREDLTGPGTDLIFTIDPPDARDFDDAIHIRKLTKADDLNARWELGVHIADVSHFVTPGSPLDEEAKERGNSTYLPRKVIPMLPELLSNGVCSLQEGVNRFTKSAFIRYDEGGNVLSARFSRSVIRSAKRLTYLEAQALIDGDLREAVKHAKTEPKYAPALLDALELADELAKTIRKRRLREGMIVLGLPAVELEFDDSGRVIDAHPEDDAFTHTLIEMFMVEANEAAARLFDGYRVPMIRRVHPDPDAHDVGALQQFARVAGFNIPARPSRKELQTLLDAVRGKPAQQAVHLAVLRTLSKAEYSPMLVGHFALASEHYTHFTSPIRRYPDLLVHRGIDAVVEAEAAGGGKAAIRKRLDRDKRLLSEDDLSQIGKHCSATEVNSEQAERQLRAFLVMQLLAEQHLGDDFEATVTGVTSSGVFMQLDKYLVDGFVGRNELPGPRDERWQFNSNTGALVAQRSGRSISIGHRFTVRIATVDCARRQMELVIVEEGADAGGGGGKKKPKKQDPAPEASGGQGKPRRGRKPGPTSATPRRGKRRR